MQWIQRLALCAMILGSTNVWAQEWESLDTPSAPKVQMWCPLCFSPMEAGDVRCPIGHEGIEPVPVHLTSCPICQTTTFVPNGGAWHCTTCGLPVKYVRRPVGLERTRFSLRDWSSAHIRGKLAYQSDWYPESSTDRRVEHQGKLTLLATGEFFVRNIRYVVAPELRLDDADLADEHITLDSKNRHRGTFAEAYLEAHSSDGRLHGRLGRQVFSRKMVEEASPLNAVFPRDFNNLLSDESIGVDALSLRFDARKDLSFEGFVIPAFTPHRLPNRTNRWSLSPFDSTIPTMPSEEIQGGLEVATRFRDIDVRGSFVRTPSRFPSLHIEPPGIPSFVYPMEHVWGIGLGFPQMQVGTKGEATVKAEGTYTVGEGKGSDDLFRYAFYTDYTVEDVVRSRDQVRAVLEYVGATVQEEGMDTEYPRFFSDAWMGALEYYPRGQTGGTKLRLVGVWNASQRGTNPTLEVGDMLIRPEASTEIGRRCTLTIGGNWLHGSSQSVFGRFEKNSGMYMDIELRF